MTMETLIWEGKSAVAFWPWANHGWGFHGRWWPENLGTNLELWGVVCLDPKIGCLGGICLPEVGGFGRPRNQAILRLAVAFSCSLNLNYTVITTQFRCITWFTFPVVEFHHLINEKIIWTLKIIGGPMTARRKKKATTIRASLRLIAGCHG